MPILRNQRTYPLTVKPAAQHPVNAGLVAAYDYVGDPANGYSGGNGVPHVGSKILTSSATPAVVAVDAAISGRDCSLGRTAIKPYLGTMIGALGFGTTDGKGSFTIHRRYRTPSVFSGTTSARVIVGYKDAGANRVTLHMTETSTYCFFKWGVQSDTTFVPSTSQASAEGFRIPFNTLVDLHLVREGDVVTAYLNGTQIASAVVPTLTTFNTNWAGSPPNDGPATGNPCDLLLIDHSIWTRALSATEVGQHTADPYVGYANSVPLAAGITITNPAPGSTINNEGFGIGGYYAGATIPSGLQYRFNGGPWTGMIDVVIENGAFSGASSLVAAATGVLEVRYSNDPTITGSVADLTAQPPPPTVAIVSQPPPDGQAQTFVLATTRANTVSVTLQAVGNGASTQGPVTEPVINDGATVNLQAIPPGDYAVAISATGDGGTASLIGTPISILGASGGGQIAGSGEDPPPPPDPEEPPVEPPPPSPTGIRMAYPDRVQETTTTTGTGNFALSGVAPAGYRTLAQAITDGDVAIGDGVHYSAQFGLEWEVGIGVVVSEQAISRNPQASSNGGNLVNFSAGTKEFFVTVTGTTIATFASSADPTTATIADINTSHFIIEEGGVTKRIPVASLFSSTGVTLGGLPLAGALADAHLIPISQDGGATEAKVSLANLKAYMGVASTPAVTSATMGGPTGGLVSVASSNFTVALAPVGGTFSGSAIFTPSDGGGGGSFTPSTLTLSSATPSGTFTYTPNATAGAKTISISNDRGLTNPANIIYTTTATATKPSTMAAPVATAGTLSASIAFVVPNNGGEAITGYTVTASTGQTATGTVSPIVITMPAGGTPTFTITATNSVGTSDPSPASNAVTPMAAATVPDAPTIGTATAGIGYVDVFFTAPANDGGSDILDYTATLSGGGGTATGTGSPIRVTAAAGTARTATVTARNSVGPSAASAASNSVTPTAAPSYTFTRSAPTAGAPATMTAPTNLTAVANGTYNNWAATDGLDTPYNVGVAPIPTDGVWGGWGKSPTTPPPLAPAGTSTTSSTMKVPDGKLLKLSNGATFTGGQYYSHPGFLFVQGVAGVTNWYWWTVTADGVQHCHNPANPLVVTLT